MASDRYTQSKTSNNINTTKFTMSVRQSTLTSTPYNYQTSISTMRLTQSTRMPTLKNDNTTGSTISLVFGVVSTVLFVATITILGIRYIYRRRIFTNSRGGETQSTTDNIEQPEMAVNKDKARTQKETVLDDDDIEVKVTNRPRSAYVNVLEMRYVEDPTEQKKTESTEQSFTYDYAGTNEITESKTQSTSYENAIQNQNIIESIKQSSVYDYAVTNKTWDRTQQSHVYDNDVAQTNTTNLEETEPKNYKSMQPKTSGKRLRVGKGKTRIAAGKGACNVKKKDKANTTVKTNEENRNTEMQYQTELYEITSLHSSHDTDQINTSQSQTVSLQEKTNSTEQTDPKEVSFLPNIQQNYENIDLKETRTTEEGGTEANTLCSNYENFPNTSPSSTFSGPGDSTDSSSSPDELRAETLIYKPKKVNVIKMYTVTS